LATPAPLGTLVLISVRTVAQYFISGGQITFRPSQGLNPQIGDVIKIVTWNDPTEQRLYTQVFVGPTTEGITVSEGYDETTYDEGAVSGDPGSFSYQTGAVVQTNRFNTGQIITNPERLFVSLNGSWLSHGVGYDVDGTYVVIQGAIINPLAVVVITSMTQSVVPGSMAFRIFQDMRGVQATYRITPDTTTTLAQPLAKDDDIIYLYNASAVDQPNLADNIWGVLTVNGERIMYRERDLAANTVSSLLRGTAGTAAADHDNESIVYDLGRGNLLPEQFQNYIVTDSTLADGSTTTFTAADIYLGVAEDSTNLDLTVEVYVGGIRVQTGYTITAEDPVVVEFDSAPADGREVTILVRRGVNWYAPGATTPSDGVPLQDTNTQAARFLRGL
jgi:hypothetical protein